MSARKATCRPKAQTSRKNADLDKILESLPKLQPIITDEQMEATEKFHQDRANWAGQARRLTLGVARLSGQRLMEIATDKDKGARLVLAMMEKRVNEYLQLMEEFTKVIGTVHARLGLALCYCEDMEELMKEAERILAAGNDPDPSIAAFSSNVTELAAVRAAKGGLS